ncbi:UNVERIFIED_CONTAM: hypothetical protein HDU68_000168, partial [Siphonaria sp. JEL0065]
MLSVASHELADASTGPAVGLANVGTTLTTVKYIWKGATVGGDEVTYVIQKQWSNSANACVAAGSGGQTQPQQPPRRLVLSAKKHYCHHEGYYYYHYNCSVLK